MSLSSGAAAFKLSFAISPIVMTGGIASNVPGGVLPVLSISDAISFVGGLLSPGDDVLDLDDYFAYFQPLPGGTLIDQTIGMYPFANQTVAANAVIQQPLAISMLMISPAGRGGGRSLVFNGHIDVVSAEPVNAWSDDPFAGTISEGRVFGRGACDMKGGIAAMVVAAETVVSECGTPPGPLRRQCPSGH